METLKVKNISHSFDDTKILNNINFSVNQGEIKSILGQSGCGKTTLLHICANLLKQTSGDINNTFSKFSFVFQEPRLLPWQNVIENIILPLKDSDIPKQKQREMAKNIAYQLGLKEIDLTKYPKDLSGGMKQKVSFARALIIKPKLLFLDEPFGALDVTLKNELYSFLLEKVKNDNLSILFITHDLIESITLSDEIIILKPFDSGSKITNIINFDKSQDKRDDKFIFEYLVKLNKTIKED